MRSVDAATLAALQAADTSGLIEADFITFHAKTLAGAQATFAFWTDLDTITANVISPLTGNEVSRNFVGDGALLDVGEIPLTSDITVRRVSITLSQIHPTVQSMVRGHDIRLAQVEIHRGLFDTATRNLVGAPYVHFVGEVNGSPIDTPAAGQEGGVRIDCVSDTRQLTRTNPAKRSDEHQRTRSGDRFMRYVGVAGDWEIFWGEAKK